MINIYFSHKPGQPFVSTVTPRLRCKDENLNYTLKENTAIGKWVKFYNSTKDTLQNYEAKLVFTLIIWIWFE